MSTSDNLDRCTTLIFCRNAWIIDERVASDVYNRTEFIQMSCCGRKARTRCRFSSNTCVAIPPISLQKIRFPRSRDRSKIERWRMHLTFQKHFLKKYFLTFCNTLLVISVWNIKGSISRFLWCFLLKNVFS